MHSINIEIAVYTQFTDFTSTLTDPVNSEQAH